ncbi:MAG: DUF2786 domain-containing protein [Pseudomonadota bacterium]
MTATQQSRLNKLRAMFARAGNTTSSEEADTAARKAREWMGRYGLTEFDVTGGPWARGTEAEYILRNFQTAKARWDRMDAEARKAKKPSKTKAKEKSTRKAKAKRTEKEKAESTEPIYKPVKVKGHYRTSKTGKRYWVGPHVRKIKVKA